MLRVLCHYCVQGKLCFAIRGWAQPMLHSYNG
jgi:hypothetical protein